MQRGRCASRAFVSRGCRSVLCLVVLFVFIVPSSGGRWGPKAAATNAPCAEDTVAAFLAVSQMLPALRQQQEDIVHSLAVLASASESWAPCVSGLGMPSSTGLWMSCLHDVAGGSCEHEVLAAGQCGGLLQGGHGQPWVAWGEVQKDLAGRSGEAPEGQGFTFAWNPRPRPFELCAGCHICAAAQRSTVEPSSFITAVVAGCQWLQAWLSKRFSLVGTAPVSLGSAVNFKADREDLGCRFFAGCKDRSDNLLRNMKWLA